MFLSDSDKATWSDYQFNNNFYSIAPILIKKKDNLWSNVKNLRNKQLKLLETNTSIRKSYSKNPNYYDTV